MEYQYIAVIASTVALCVVILANVYVRYMDREENEEFEQRYLDNTHG